MSEVEVCVMRAGRKGEAFMQGLKPGQPFIRVKLSSEIITKTGVPKKFIDLNPADYDSERAFMRDMAIKTGAIAEMQNEELGDNHDPDEIARTAIEAYEELKAEMEQRARDNPQENIHGGSTKLR